MLFSHLIHLTIFWRGTNAVAIAQDTKQHTTVSHKHNGQGVKIGKLQISSLPVKMAASIQNHVV